MPELPDLVYIEKKLRPVVLNEEIREVAVWEPIVLRMGVPGSFSDVLPGKQIGALRRRGPFLVFALPPLAWYIPSGRSASALPLRRFPARKSKS